MRPGPCWLSRRSVNVNVAMFCGMNFTTTGIECGTSRARALRVEDYTPLTAAVPLTKKHIASEVPFSATKATQTERLVVVAPQLGQKRAAQGSSANPKKARKKTFVENPEYSSSSSSTPPSSLWSLPSSPSTTWAKDHDRRSAEPLEARKLFNAESSSSLNGDGHSCELSKNDTSKAASADRSTSKQSKPLADHKSHRGENHSQPAQKKGNKAPPEKRVRFALDVQEKFVSPHRDPPSETSSSDGSDCSYIDLPAPTGPDNAIPGHTHVFNASEPYRYGPASMTIYPRPVKRFANKPFLGLPSDLKNQSVTSKTPLRTRAPEPIVVLGSGLKKSNRQQLTSQLPAVIKTIMKNPPTEQRSITSNDDKENSLQYDERLGLTFRDL